jgi:endonuclease/exonuclease/phosphatase family metal-dependent hydrolase
MAISALFQSAVSGSIPGGGKSFYRSVSLTLSAPRPILFGMKLVTLNIYAGIYLDKSISHLEKIAPDVLCLQELHEDDIGQISDRLAMPHHLFVPSVRVVGENRFGFREGQIGIGIMSKTPLTHEQVDYYHKVGDDLPVFDPNHGNHCNRALLSAEVATPEGKVRVSTTHFTWTHDGNPTSQQREHVAELTEMIQRQNVDILCGDFNAPHGSEIMAHISNLMDDHMPTGVDTTIDENLHRAKGLKLVVDNVFTRRGLAQVDLQIQDGMSDHKALIATFLFHHATKRESLAAIPRLPMVLPSVALEHPPAAAPSRQR